MPDERQGPSFGRRVNRAPRLSDRVSEMMLETILDRGLQPGDQLPSERELGEQYGVSRTVIREAVRSLAAKGVVDVQSGRGLLVAAVDASQVSDTMSLYIRGRHRDLPYSRVNEVRSAIEIDMAGLAAERASTEEIEELRQAHEDMGAVLTDVEAASKADVAFHRTIARLTHNELFLVILDSIGDVMLEIRRATLGLPNDAERGQEEHARILDAITQHDPAAARKAMREHLAAADAVWRRVGPVVVKVADDS